MLDPKITLRDKAAVIEALPDHPGLKAVLAWNPDALTGAKLDRAEVSLMIAPNCIREACRVVRDAGYNAFQDVTAVDWLPTVPRFQLSYHICSYSFKEMLRLCVMVDEAEASVESITPVWPGANYYEREIFDLFGIRFEGHPNLRRIMMPEEWVGHPLRKDYPVEGYR
jgi:NADH-quinone oxidoreductase subunit C